MVACNADLDHPCDANDGEPCAKCAKSMRLDDEYFRGLWATATYAERHPYFYRKEMIEGGRGHLLRDEERTRQDDLDERNARTLRRCGP